MRSIDIGIGHNDDFMISCLCNIEGLLRVLDIIVVPGKTCTDGGNYRLKLVVSENLVFLCLFHIEHLSPERKDGLESSVTALLCGSACRVSLNDENLTLCGILFRAVGKLTGKSAALTLLSYLLTG